MNIRKVASQYADIYYFNAIKKSLKNCDSILDVGCGDNSPVGHARGKTKATGFELFPDCIKASKKKKLHSDYVLGDATNLSKYFKKSNYDVVIAIDVIEHVTKKEGFALIKQMEKIAKKRIVFLTPNGFYPQDTLFGNPHQVHKSGWNREDFEKIGYRVTGLRGLKYLRGIHASIKYKPWILWGVIAFVTEPVLNSFPDLSYDLFAIKDLS